MRKLPAAGVRRSLRRRTTRAPWSSRQVKAIVAVDWSAGRRVRSCAAALATSGFTRKASARPARLGRSSSWQSTRPTASLPALLPREWAMPLEPTNAGVLTSRSAMPAVRPGMRCARVREPSWCHALGRSSGVRAHSPVPSRIGELVALSAYPTHAIAAVEREPVGRLLGADGLERQLAVIAPALAPTGRAG
jgi:hypothetical protein